MESTFEEAWNKLNYHFEEKRKILFYPSERKEYTYHNAIVGNNHVEYNNLFTLSKF